MPEEVDGALERFIAALKKTEPADSRRVSRIVRAAVARSSPMPVSWFAGRRTLSVRAIAAVAAAAALVGVVAGGVLDSTLRHSQSPGLANVPAGMEPLQLPVPLHEAAAEDFAEQPLSVQFVLIAPEARSVALVGDFNGWDPSAQQLSRDEGGIWSASVVLNPGRHAYAFIVNDSVWTRDPNAPYIEDPDFGRAHSVRVFGGM